MVSLPPDGNVYCGGMDDAGYQDGSAERIAELEREVLDLEHRFSRLRGYLDAVSSGYWDWNIATGEVDFSDNWLAALGYSREDCSGRVDFWEQCVHPDDMPVVFRKVQEHFQKKNAFYSCENRLRLKSGEYRPNLDSGLVVEWDAEGRPQRMVGTDTDMSKLRDIEAELRRSRHDLELQVEARTAALSRTNEALSRSNAELRRFATAASHDLQEPLRQIVSFAQLIRDEYQGDDGDATVRHAQYLVAAAKRLREMVRGLLAYARCDRDLAVSECDFRSIAREVVDDLAARVTETGAQVRITGDVRLRADPAGLRIVLHNLVLNALKYAGDEPPDVQLSIDENQDRWRAACRDRGEGILADQRSRVFELFARLHAHDDVPGSGMGLATARRIVEAHGGELWIEDTPPPGTCFVFTIPKRRATVRPEWSEHAG